MNMKTLLLNALVTAVVLASCLVGLEAFRTWQRVNALWAWAAVQEQARAAAAPRVLPTPPPAQAPKK